MQSARSAHPSIAWSAPPSPIANGSMCCAIRVRPRFILKYLKGLVAAIEAKGGSFHCDTLVEGFEERDDGKVLVTASGGTITARSAVVATNSPIVDRFALHTKMAPYRTYAMAFSIPKGAIPDALYWDTLTRTIMFGCSQAMIEPILIAGGGDHRSGEADDAEVRFQKLEAWTRNLIPAVKDVTHRWSGQVLDTIDYADSSADPGSTNIYVHTGDSGQGMTHGVVGAMINSSADPRTRGQMGRRL